ncbi:MAG: 5'-nucleotidase C-terminal domain-containing protein [Prevotellaceae bacterium]|nr:5'-nucleotidase C-terminal domain-containing protein [Prevotellaceae bacterium]
MKKIATTALVLLSLTTTIMAETKNVRIKVLATSDIHGCFFPYNFIERKEMKGSLARASHYVKEQRKEFGQNLILLDNGDILQGQPTCYYCNYVNPKMPNAAATAINYMKYDAQAMGNHDIETGHAVYDKWISEVKCPMLGANVVDKVTGKPYLKPYIVLERENVKIAVLGLLTPAIPNWLHESLWSGLHFEEMVECSKRWVKHIKDVDNPDVIVGLFHSGWNGGISTLHYNEDATESVAKNVDGFDIIFLGHDHNKRKAIIKSTTGKDVLCLDPSCNAMYIADATIDITFEDGKVKDKQIEGLIADISDTPIDQDFVHSMKAVEDSVRQYTGRKIGTFTKTISTSDCFFGSSPFNDFIHEIQLNVTGAEISFNAPLTFESKINEGDVFMSDMFKLYRYENQMYVMKMRGKEVRKHLEMSYDQWVNTMTSPDDHIMLLSEKTQYDRQKCGFKNLTFNFDSAAGIDYVVDVTKPNGQKVKILQMSNGEPFVEDKWYRVVMNSYRGNGGGELLTKGAGISAKELESRIMWKSDKDQRYYIIKEIEKKGTVTPITYNNWKFIPEEWTKDAIERDKEALFGNKK